MGQPYSAAYCSSKAGVVNLTKALAVEYLKRKVRVNCVAPGGIETPLQEAFMEMPEGVTYKDLRAIMTPLGNSTPEEIANVVAFVASDECRYMTAAVVSVDGGLTHDRRSRSELMFDDACVSVWELIDRRADASPDRVMLYDGDRRHDVCRVPRHGARGGRGLSRPRRRRGHERLVAAPDVDRVGGARRRAVPARRGAEPDAADLPLPRGQLHREADALLAAHHALGVESLRLRRARATGRRRAAGDAHVGRRSPQPDRRSCDAAGAAAVDRRPGRRSGALDLLHVGHDRGSEGRAAHRPQRDGRGDRLREEDARRRPTTSRSSRSRSRTSAASSSACSRRCSPARPRCSWRRGPPPASTELIVKHGVTLGNGAPAIHAALLAEAKANPEAYRTIRDFPSGGSTKPPALHYDLMEAVPTSVGMTSGYGLTEMPILSQTDIDAPDESKRDGEGTPNEGVVDQARRPRSATTCRRATKASSSRRVRRSCAATSTRRSTPPRSPPTGSSAPATSRASTRTARSSSPAG